jgi:DNA-binding beta-propeller fold protein YncE
MAPKKNKTQAKTQKKIKISLGVFALVVMGLILFGDLLYLAKLWTTPPQSFNVQQVFKINGETSPCGIFKPWDAVAAQSGFYISDQANNRIIEFNRDGKYIDSITSKEAGKPDFKELSSITMTPAGDIYCIDTWNNLLRGFNRQHHALAQINIGGKGFYGPRGVAYSNGEFVIADTGSHRVAKVSSQGDLVGAWGTHGSGKVEFNNPTQVIADDQSRYYVADRDNHRIQCLDNNGKFVWETSVTPAPVAEAIDTTHHLLYVSTGQAINVYDFMGKVLGTFNTLQKSGQTFDNVIALSVFPDGDVLSCQGGSATVYHPLQTTTTVQTAAK